MKKIQKNKRAYKFSALLMVSVLLVVILSTMVFGADAKDYIPALYSSIWALLPPIVAIALALITKEVYSSLFIGILVGAILYGGGNVERTIMHTFGDDKGGFVSVLTDSYNVGILIFLVILGTIVAMMNKAGGSAAFGNGQALTSSQELGHSLPQFYLAYWFLLMIILTALQ